MTNQQSPEASAPLCSRLPCIMQQATLISWPFLGAHIHCKLLLALVTNTFRRASHTCRCKYCVFILLLVTVCVHQV